MTIFKPLIWSAIISCIFPSLVLAGMDGIPSLTINEAVELGFEIELEPSQDDECTISVTVVAPKSLDGRTFLGMNHALYRGEELLFFPEGINDWRTHSFLIAAEMLPTLVVLPVYSDDERGYGYQILFGDVESNCE